MQLIETLISSYKFETSNGCTFTRERLNAMNIAYELQDYKGTRALYHLTDYDRTTFPQATHRIELTAGRDQSDPLFVTAPCWIKDGTKHQLVYILDDNNLNQARIKKVYDWT